MRLARSPEEFRSLYGITDRTASCTNGCGYHLRLSGASIQPYRCPHCHSPLTWDDPNAREGGKYRLENVL